MNKKRTVKIIPGIALGGMIGLFGMYASSVISQEIQPEATATPSAPAEDTSSQDSSLDYLPVSVTFDGDNCPIGVSVEELDVTQGNKVVWKAYDNQNPANPIEKKDYFSVHFDPFKGRELVSKSDGEIKSGPINPDAPATPEGVVYKYTILGIECTRDEPLDPRFKVRR